MCVVSTLQMPLGGHSSVAVPPICNTGVPSGGVKIRPDWVTVVFPAAYGHISKGVSVLADFLCWYRLARPLPACSMVEKTGMHGYEKGIFCRASFSGDLLFSILYGGNGHTVRLEITGAGCARMDVLDWWNFCRLVRRGAAYVTRFDLAGDDYSGDFLNPRKARRDYARRYADILPSLRFSNRIPKPGVHDTDKGYTVDFGTANMLVNHCVYEKGKESAGTRLALENPNWIRWEVRWRRRKSKFYCIDVALMRPDNWVPAYMGACPYVADLVGYNGDARAYINRVVRGESEVADKMARLLRVVRMQYGKVLNTAHGLLGVDRFLPQILAREGHAAYRTLVQDDLLSALKGYRHD